MFPELEVIARKMAGRSNKRTRLQGSIGAGGQDRPALSAHGIPTAVKNAVFASRETSSLECRHFRIGPTKYEYLQSISPMIDPCHLCTHRFTPSRRVAVTTITFAAKVAIFKCDRIQTAAQFAWSAPASHSRDRKWEMPCGQQCNCGQRHWAIWGIWGRQGIPQGARGARARRRSNHDGR